VINFYPETGFVVPETTSLFFFEAWTSSSESEIVDFTGAKLIEVTGEEETVLQNEIKTEHKGRGSVEFFYKEGSQYFLELAV